MENLRAGLLKAQIYVQAGAMVLLVLIAIGLVIATLLAAFGAIPWPEVIVFWNTEQIVSAGMWMQVGLTALAVALCFFLPANGRILRLETSHRKFNVSMDDITRAYIAAHSGDRAGAFQLSDEFDQMRARLGFLRKHPDLGDLEPELLEIAAQMSFESRDLANRYSDERVNRARSFLQERQHELERFNDRLEHAKAINSEFKVWINRVELEESVAAAKMEGLLQELEEVLPELSSLPAPESSKVMVLPKRAD